MIKICAYAMTTADIVEKSISALPNCARYKITGVCFWLDCKGAICKGKITPYVDHFLPDAVVSVYHDKDNNPWDYARTVDRLASSMAEAQIYHATDTDMGWGNSSAGSIHEANVHFKEVNIIGNPAILFFNRLNDFYLPSVSKPFIPYYQSLLDSVTWRLGLTEMFYPATFTPGAHEIGNFPSYTWGSVYPRVGFVNQPDDAKAAAVLAQRAADIVSKSKQPHIYNSDFAKLCGEHCQIIQVKENDAQALQWQMIYPSESNQCTIFGLNDLKSKEAWGSDVAQKSDDYVWIMWRHYKGCISSNGPYLGQVHW